MKLFISNTKQFGAAARVLSDTDGALYAYSESSREILFCDAIECCDCGLTMAGANPVSLRFKTDGLRRTFMTWIGVLRPTVILDKPLPEHAGFNEEKGDTVCAACLDKLNAPERVNVSDLLVALRDAIDGTDVYLQDSECGACEHVQAVLVGCGLNVTTDDGAFRVTVERLA